MWHVCTVKCSWGLTVILRRGSPSAEWSTSTSVNDNNQRSSLISQRKSLCVIKGGREIFRVVWRMIQNPLSHPSASSDATNKGEKCKCSKKAGVRPSVHIFSMHTSSTSCQARVELIPAVTSDSHSHLRITHQPVHDHTGTFRTWK